MKKNTMTVQDFNNWMEYHDALHPMLENSIFECDDISIARDLFAGKFPPLSLFHFADANEGREFWEDLRALFEVEVEK